MNPSLDYVLEYQTAKKSKRISLSKKIIKYKTLIFVISAFFISLGLSISIALICMR